MSQTSPQYTTLFLDIGGVLLTNGWDSAARRKAAEKFDIDFEDMNERHHLTFDTYEEGKLTLSDYLERVIFCHQRPFSKETFIEYMYAQTKPFPETIALFHELKERYRLKVITVSNEGRELTEYRIHNFGLKSLVDGFVSSCFVHYRKPDVDIFCIALDIAQTQPEHVIYIDDRELFIEVANSLDIHGMLHTGYQATRDALADLGLESNQGLGL
jgi:putative hydrolase of the HAD superfamily